MGCELCPRRCGTDRAARAGFCRASEKPVVAKTMVHRWEEPPISGTKGSGAVFFAGCNLRCVFCQNHAISRDAAGEGLDPPQLAERFWALAEAGVHNINLVTPAHVLPGVAAAVAHAKRGGFPLPFVYNTNGYESVSALRRLEGLIDVYLPDFKYSDEAAAVRYANAPGYPALAAAAVLEMARQVGVGRVDDDGLMRRGLVIRHLVLPGRRRDAMRVLDWVAAHLPDAHVSLMAQYFPTHRAGEYPELNRRVTTFEYESVTQYFQKLGLKHGFFQHRAAATPDCVPAF
ncbi:MAG: radical SAM protein [Oscillospiraceae bacterium]|nr:radical SAM protein [Oscillospiraceae bacterium]